MNDVMSYNDVRMAIKKRYLAPWFQTLHSAVDGTFTGVEILARIEDPLHGTILPVAFLSTLECHELALSATACMMDVVTDVLKDIGHFLPSEFTVSFNTGAGLLNHPELITLCTRLSARLRPGIRLCTELTERQAFYHDVEEEMAIKKLRWMGVKVVLDDFGIAHSDFRLLSRYETDGIKIPRELVGGGSPGSRADIIEEMIIETARTLGMEITVEGITTAGQYQRLRSRGVDFMQGYYFSRPVCATDFKLFCTQNAVNPKACSAI